MRLLGLCTPHIHLFLKYPSHADPFHMETHHDSPTRSLERCNNWHRFSGFSPPSCCCTLNILNRRVTEKGDGGPKWGQNSWCPWRANYFWVSLFPSSTPPGPLKPKTIICAINRSIQVLIGLKYIKPHPVSKVHIPAPLSILWSRRSNTAFHICACIQSYTRSEKRVKSFLERASLFRSQGFPRVHMATEKKQEEKVLFLSRNKEEKRRRKTRVYSCPVCGPRDPFFPTRYDDAGSPTLAKKEIEQKDSQLGASHKKNI